MNINDGSYIDGPFIARDESFLIFESDREGGAGSIDLYICFKDSNNNWSTPKNMGPKINSPAAERFAGLSPDGKYFFFGSNRSSTLPDLYWIDASVINELR
jgi:Tol biopolymer transport system component